MGGGESLEWEEKGVSWVPIVNSKCREEKILMSYVLQME